MSYSTTLTSQGQVTIPADIREFLGLKPADKVIFEKEDNKVTVRPAKDFLRLGGSIKTKIKFGDAEADKKVAK